MGRTQVSHAGNHEFKLMVESTPVTYKVDTHRILARCSTLFWQGKDWLAQWHDNVTELDIRS